MSVTSRLSYICDPLTKLGKKIEPKQPEPKMCPFKEFEMEATVTGRIPSKGVQLCYKIRNYTSIIHRAASHSTAADRSDDGGKTWTPWQYKRTNEFDAMEQVEVPL